MAELSPAATGSGAFASREASRFRAVGPLQHRPRTVNPTAPSCVCMACRQSVPGCPVRVSGACVLARCIRCRTPTSMLATGPAAALASLGDWRGGDWRAAGGAALELVFDEEQFQPSPPPNVSPRMQAREMMHAVCACVRVCLCGCKERRQSCAHPEPVRPAGTSTDDRSGTIIGAAGLGGGSWRSWTPLAAPRLQSAQFLQSIAQRSYVIVGCSLSIFF